MSNDQFHNLCSTACPWSLEDEGADTADFITTSPVKYTYYIVAGKQLREHLISLNNTVDLWKPLLTLLPRQNQPKVFNFANLFCVSKQVGLTLRPHAVAANDDMLPLAEHMHLANGDCKMRQPFEAR